MAKVIAIGQPVNDAERRAIAHLRDHLPSTCTLIHNFELRYDKEVFEIDLAVLAPHAVYLVDVKGTFGHIDIYGSKWHPTGRQPFTSPLVKLRQHAKVFKTLLCNAYPHELDLRRIHVHAATLLTAPDASVTDHGNLDGPDIVKLAKSLVYFLNKSHVPDHRFKDISRFLLLIQKFVQGNAHAKSAPLTFRDWQVEQKLGGDERHTDYRAKHTFLGRGGGTVRLRVYQADPLEPDGAKRAAEQNAISAAFRALAQMPPHPNIVGVREFFATESGDQFVLVTEDVLGLALRQHLQKPELAQTFDQKLRIMRDTLNALSHAHSHQVVHRNLTPDATLVGVDGRTRLIEFDYARVLADPSQTIGSQIAGQLDPQYIAPECVANPSQASPHSDLFSAGLVFYHLLTGQPAFADSAQMLSRQAVFPIPASAVRPGLLPALDDWLQKLCAERHEQRFANAEEALKDLNERLEASLPSPEPSTTTTTPAPDFAKLPRGHMLDDRFIVQEPLGQPGSFGVVYKVFDTYGDVARALKLVLRNRGPVLDRLRQEYRALAALPEHPNVVRVIWADRLPADKPSEKPIPYLVFEYLDGYTVKEFLNVSALSLDDARTITMQVAAGLAHLHKHDVYHQDIKPSNLLWTDQGVRIIDFNVALTELDESASGGTRRYLPPGAEHVLEPTEEDKVDRDLYGLGITFYECVTGRYPFETDTPSAHTPPRDPREFDGLNDLHPAWANVLLKAIAPNQAERYKTAEEYQEALKKLSEPRLKSSQLPTPPAALMPILAQARPNVNPFVSHLLTLYSQSRRTNAGTRGLDAVGQLTYVETLLDTQLRSAVLTGEFRLIIITGNAGDGKTAFIQQVERYAADQGAKVQGVVNGARFTWAGREFYSNYDGSQDEGDKDNSQVLLEFFAPFAGDDPSTWPENRTHLIAINEGRLVEFLDQHYDRFPRLQQLVRDGLNETSTAADVAVINLNLRAVIADHDGPNSSIFDRLVRRLVAPEFWQACQGCDLRDRCYIHHNARTLADPVAGPRVIERLKMLYTATHLRGRLHITLRDLRSALAFMLAGKHDCDEVHALYQRGPEALDDILDGFYFNAWRGGRNSSADRLVSLLAEMDIGEASTPDLDRRLAFLRPNAQPLSRYTFDGRGGYDDQLCERVFNELALRPEGDQVKVYLAKHRHYVAMARRRYYFECRDERPDTGWLSLLPYRQLKRFLEMASQPETLAEQIDELLQAINRGEGLANPERVPHRLALRVRVVERGTIRSYRLFDGDSFESGPTLDPARRRFLEYLPTGVKLRYRSAAGQIADFNISLDVYEMLNRLNDGYQPSLEEQQGFYRTLVVFKNMLASAPYQEVLLTESGHDFYRVRREHHGVLSFRPVKEEELAMQHSIKPTAAPPPKG